MEPVHAEMSRDVKLTYNKLLQAIGVIQNGSGGWKGAGEVFDLLRAYPRKRFRFAILELALSAFRKLLGSTPEYLPHIGTCRAGLMDMQAAIAASGKANGGDPAGPGRLILPEGCANLDDAADRFLAGLNPADVLTFDQALQKEISKKFRGLAAICLKPLEKGPPFREMLLAQLRTPSWMGSSIRPIRRRCSSAIAPAARRIIRSLARPTRRRCLKWAATTASNWRR